METIDIFTQTKQVAVAHYDIFHNSPGNFGGLGGHGNVPGSHIHPMIRNTNPKDGLTHISRAGGRSTTHRVKPVPREKFVKLLKVARHEGQHPQRIPTIDEVMSPRRGAERIADRVAERGI